MKLYSRTDAQTTRKTLAIFRTVLGEEKKRLVISSIFIPLQHLLYLVILPLFISLYVQSLLEHSFNTPYQLWLIIGIPYQLWLIIGMAVAGIGSLIAARIGFIAMFNHEEAMTTKLSEHAMRGLLSQSHTFFANSKVGALAGDVNTFSRSYLSLLDTVFLQASSIVVNFVASLIVVAFIAPIMLPVMIVLTYFVIALALRSYNRRSPLRNERKELQSKLMGTFGDIIGNQTLVRMFGRKDTEIHSVLEQRKKIEKIATEEIRILENGAELRLGVLVAFQIVVLVLCGWLLSIDMLTIAGLIFIVTYLGRVTGSLFALSW